MARSVQRPALILMLAGLAACHRGPETYEVACATPPQGWRSPAKLQAPATVPSMPWPVLLVRVNAGGDVFLEEHKNVRSAYRGERVAAADLPRLLAEAADRNPNPTVILDASAIAPCDRVRQVRRAMQRPGACPRCSEGHDWETWN